MPPQSRLLAYGPASPVNRSVELVLTLEESYVAYAPSRDAQRRGARNLPGTGHTLRWHAERCSPPVKPVPNAPHFNLDDNSPRGR